MQRTEGVQTYFTDRARLFDTLYDGDSHFEQRFNRVFRRAMFERYVRTLDALRPLDGRRFLDVGCGSGRYAMELAAGGASVVGVDFSSEMISMANERAASTPHADMVEFEQTDFIEWAAGHEGGFDAAFAMGVLDYVDDAEGFVGLMAGLAQEVIISFPVPTPLRMPLRKMRYALRGCPVHFYWPWEIKRIYAAAGLKDVELRWMGPSAIWARGRHDG